MRYARRRRFERAALAALAAALLASLGCAVNPPPVDTAPGVDAPPRFESASEGETPGDSGTPWWTSFEDPELARLVAEALTRNRDLEAAAARVEAAQAQARIAGADLRPSIGAGLDGARRRQNFVGFPIPGGGEVLSTTTTTFQSGLDISWEVDLWNRLRAGRAGAMSAYQASRLEYEAARLSLSGQVAKAWFGVVEAGQQVALARRTVDNRRLTRERLRRRYQTGLTPALELRLAIAEHAAAEALLAERERQADAAQRRLELLVHRYPDGTRDGTAPDGAARHELPPLPPPIPAGTPAELVSRRPDLAAAEARLAASGYQVVAARRALYPRLTLVGSAGTLSAEVEDLLDQDYSVWNLAGGLLAPIFQGGRLRAAVDLAEARRDEALAGYVRRLLAAFGEVEEGLAAERFLAARRDALETSAHETVAAQRLAEEQYAAGLVDYLIVLETQRRALGSQAQLLAAERQLLEARVDLHLALGGDWRRSEDGPSPDAPPDATPSSEELSS